LRERNSISAINIFLNSIVSEGLYRCFWYFCVFHAYYNILVLCDCLERWHWVSTGVWRQHRFFNSSKKKLPWCTIFRMKQNYSTLPMCIQFFYYQNLSSKQGMNWLHLSKPPFLHRFNLLVDRIPLLFEFVWLF